MKVYEIINKLRGVDVFEIKSGHELNTKTEFHGTLSEFKDKPLSEISELLESDVSAVFVSAVDYTSNVVIALDNKW